MELEPTLEVWDYSVGFIRPWTLQLQQVFVVWFSQGSDQSVFGIRAFNHVSQLQMSEVAGDAGIVVFIWD